MWRTALEGGRQDSMPTEMRVEEMQEGWEYEMEPDPEDGPCDEEDEDEDEDEVEVDNEDEVEVEVEVDNTDDHDNNNGNNDKGENDGRNSESSESVVSDSEQPYDDSVRRDMQRLQEMIPGFRKQYRLIKRIGEGTFSTVYKAEDLQYDRYDNSWDLDQEEGADGSGPGPDSSGRRKNNSSQANGPRPDRRRPKFVAIKKIYVTSSPNRILNELELLHALRGCPAVAPLITAFRHTDQVIAVLPYHRHQDFREYFRNMLPVDMAVYMRSLFAALAAVHARGIMHRDIKPTNFLYDPQTMRGVLVDFGLAEREGSDFSKACLCHAEPAARRHRLRTAQAYAHAAGAVPSKAYPIQDTRPSRRANRAGTRGFRAPEVLFKCTEQTTKIDVWSAGVILLTMLSRRFPFFNSTDDVEAMIEIASIFGQRRMRQAGLLHACVFETDIPTIGTQGFGLDQIILWSTCRSDDGKGLSEEETLAVQFLNRCLDLDPDRRISAEQALAHDFLQLVDYSEEEMDMLNV